jgi:hypothetical protein
MSNKEPQKSEGHSRATQAGWVPGGASGHWPGGVLTFPLGEKGPGAGFRALPGAFAGGRLAAKLGYFRFDTLSGVGDN